MVENLHSFSVLPNLERKTSLKERFVGILLVELPIYLLYHDGTDYVVKLSLIDIWNLDGKLKILFMQKRNLLVTIVFLFIGVCGMSAERIRQNFDFDWQFRLGEQGTYKTVQLPHDWKDFTVPLSYKGKRVSIVFDGIYHKATIYLNGREIDYHRYGYTSFETDLTPYLKYGENNTLSVRVDHSEKSRWYTGSGIYRHAWLQVTDTCENVGDIRYYSPSVHVIGHYFVCNDCCQCFDISREN